MNKIWIITEQVLTRKSGSLIYKIIEDVIDETTLDDFVFGSLADTELPEGVSVIMPMGSAPVKFFTGKGSNLKEQVGVETEYKGLPVRPMVSPAYLENDKGYLELFVKEFYTTYRRAKGKKETRKLNDHKILTTIAQVKQLCEYCKQTGDASFDWETNHADIYKDTFFPTMLSISFQHGSSHVIPFWPPKPEEQVFTDEELSTIVDILKDEIFMNPDVLKIAHNAKFDLKVCAWVGIPDFRGTVHDTMTAHHILNENSKQGLKDFVYMYMTEFSGYEQEVKKKFAEMDLPTLAKYGAIDSDVTLRFHTWFTHKLMQDKELYILYRNLVCAVMKPLYELERDGIQTDQEYVKKAVDEAAKIMEQVEADIQKLPKVKKFKTAMQKEANLAKIQELEEKLETNVRKRRESRGEEINSLQIELKELEGLLRSGDLAKREQKRIDTITKQLRKLKTPYAVEDKYREQIRDLKAGASNAYGGFNINSNEQLGEFFYGDHGLAKPLPIDYKTKEPKRKTDEATMETFKDKSGFIHMLLVYRKVKKMHGTYLKAIAKKVDKGGIIRASYNQNGTVTGRISSSNPNMQNIPRGTKFKDDAVRKVVGMVKQCFVPRPDSYIVQADYSQAELRLAAHFANEEKMIEAYNQGQDLHRLTVLNIMGVSEAEYDAMPDYERKELRTSGKMINFGLIYGVSPFGLQMYAKRTFGVELTDKEAVKYHKGFFRLYPNLELWHVDYINRARTQGYVKTLFGRRRHLEEDITSWHDRTRESAERQSINAPVQGTAGEFTLFAMAVLHNRLHPDVRLINTVHDSVIYDIPKHLLDDQIRLIADTAENLPYQTYFNCPELKCPMKVDVEISDRNWASIKEHKFR